MGSFRGYKIKIYEKGREMSGFIKGSREPLQRALITTSVHSALPRVPLLNTCGKGVFNSHRKMRQDKSRRGRQSHSRITAASDPSCLPAFASSHPAPELPCHSYPHLCLKLSRSSLLYSMAMAPGWPHCCLPMTPDQ